jgi:Mg-chelatase subunit ChlD
MPFSPNVIKNPNAAKEAAIKAAKEAAEKPKEEAAIQKWITPSECADRIRIIFDDSGSMSGRPIEDARKGVIEFLRNCIPNQTAVAIQCMNDGEAEYAAKYAAIRELQSNLVALASTLKDQSWILGGTPLFATLQKTLKLTPKATRVVMFSDGEPSDLLLAPHEQVHDALTNWMNSADVALGRENTVPVDTVFFGPSVECRAAKLLKYIADKSGGYFLHFDPRKVNFGTAFKYLAPVNRKMLASSSFRAEVESGKKN